MSDMPANQVPDAKNPLNGHTHLSVLVLSAIVAPAAAGLALGVAAIVGGEVLLGVFHLHPGADPGLAILFVLVLIAVLLAGILFV
jgi:hypothetical protein